MRKILSRSYNLGYRYLFQAFNIQFESLRQEESNQNNPSRLAYGQVRNFTFFLVIFLFFSLLLGFLSFFQVWHFGLIYFFSYLDQENLVIKSYFSFAYQGQYKKGLKILFIQTSPIRLSLFRNLFSLIYQPFTFSYCQFSIRVSCSSSWYDQTIKGTSILKAMIKECRHGL